MAKTRIGVIGCAGRMGRMLIREIAGTEGCALAGGTVRSGGAALGQDLGVLGTLGRLGLAATDDPEQLLRSSDVAIEFTAPAATAEHAALAARVGTPLVIGTTALDAREAAAVRDAAQSVPIVWAANTSLGINILLGLVEQVAQRLGPEWDIEILEMHHRQKVDAPSGTALALGAAAAAGRGVSLDEAAVRGRDGITGPRRSGAIGFAALRGGDNIGEHHIFFSGTGEQLALSHRASHRGIYATGAVRAARWVVGRSPGLYGMREVLGL
ncbi:MAG TPA: 4-hydroxy-tetrahydrodipicolinate reductase [Stellaceae bacterium]|nr:4-hydroxy-tetrahydrodipicolinate reductase [Stellaceae bacterium]